MTNVVSCALHALNPRQRDVLAILKASSVPLSAYEILYASRGMGLKTPIQIYRVLKILTQLALVHRVETLNGYIACTCDHADGEEAVLAICNRCGTVTEYAAPPHIKQLAEMVQDVGFESQVIKVEILGMCQDCRGQLNA